MTYRKPEVAVLGNAVVVIQGSKPLDIEPDAMTVPGVIRFP